MSVIAGKSTGKIVIAIAGARADVDAIISKGASTGVDVVVSTDASAGNIICGTIMSADKSAGTKAKVISSALASTLGQARFSIGASLCTIDRVTGSEAFVDALARMLVQS